jgi:hypothetical protein
VRIKKLSRNLPTGIVPDLAWTDLQSSVILKFGKVEILGSVKRNCVQLVLTTMGDVGDLPTDRTPLSVFRTSVKSTELFAIKR